MAPGAKPSSLLSSSPDLSAAGGGVLKRPRTRSGNLGTGRGGSTGDASPSAVEALERAGDDAIDGG